MPHRQRSTGCSARRCGTRLFTWRKNGTAAGVALATFDDRNAFAPTEHIWVAEKMDWVKLDDGLPQYPGIRRLTGKFL